MVWQTDMLLQGSASQSEHTKEKNRRGKGLAASRDHNEARRRAYGDRDSTKQKIDLDGDLGGCCGSARVRVRAKTRVGGFSEAKAAI